jgi:hypothetical protein
MIIFEEPEMATHNFLPCANCNQKRVVKPGDWCNQCAMRWERKVSEYFVVDPQSISDVHEISGISRSYLNAKQERAFEKNCKYVVFYAQGKWKEVVISDRFHLPTVMKNILSRLDE